MMRPERFSLQEILLQGQSTEQFGRLITQINREALFVYPTETIYGIGGIATEKVQHGVFQAKQRRPRNPLILVGGSVHVFSKYNITFSRKAELLAEAFWPGNLTLILQVAGSDEKLGIRVSDHPFLQIIKDHVALPLYSTSANISGEEYQSDPDFIYSLFAEEIDFMIDYGTLPASLPSTVVDVSSRDQYTVVREGAVSVDALQTVLDK